MLGDIEAGHDLKARYHREKIIEGYLVHYFDENAVYPEFNLAAAAVYLKMDVGRHFFDGVIDDGVEQFYDGPGFTGEVGAPEVLHHLGLLARRRNRVLRALNAEHPHGAVHVVF